jgi:serine/threonine-protein kinase
MTLPPGTRVGPYEVVGLLGAGGMGEVYRARDPRLGREVAVKVLPKVHSRDPERLHRFEQEARAAGTLNHPNILAIHDVGTHGETQYVVSELLEGETLRERLRAGTLTTARSVEYAGQIAQGLAAAHTKGIVHRDLKPENIFVTRDGRIKILDFGLAKLTHAEADGAAKGEEPTLTRDTTPGAVLGTPGYMSPEQVAGRPADHRSDIFCLGTVVYEMLTGRPAFKGDTNADTMHAILREDPPALSTGDRRIPSPLARVVQRCLEKRPEDRFQSAHDVAFALQALSEAPESRAPLVGRRSVIVGSSLVAVLAALLALDVGGLRGRHPPPVDSIRSLAVLPLENLSRDPDQEFFADGMTDSLITQLAKIGAVRVVSRTSVMRYKRTRKPISEIARDLQVDAVVEGSVEHSGGRVRITAQLIRAATDHHLWAESYERDMRDVLLLQAEVARAIAGEIQIKLTPQDHAALTSPRRVDPEAYELYLKGRYFWNFRTERSVEKAIAYFRQSIDRDPSYAVAYSGLADCYSVSAHSYDLGSVAPAEAFPKAKAAVAKALQIDDKLADAHNSLGFIKLIYDWDLPGAEEEFKRALELGPQLSNAHHWYAHYLIVTGQKDAALAEGKRALELDPLNPILNTHLGWHYLMAHEYDNALAQLRKTLDLDSNYGLAHWYMGLVYEQKRMYPEAVRELDQADGLLGHHLVVRGDLAHTHAVSGNRVEARKILGDLEKLSRQRYVSAFEIAVIHLGLDQGDEAFRWLDTAYRERADPLIYLKDDPRLDPVRADPRFRDVLRRVGLPQ